MQPIYKKEVSKEQETKAHYKKNKKILQLWL